MRHKGSRIPKDTVDRICKVLADFSIPSSAIAARFCISKSAVVEISRKYSIRPPKFRIMS